jgi:L-threonylcarbamoyladenylate synthase
VKTILTDDPIEAAAIIRAGGSVAFPTETVYGLGADALNGEAVAKIFEAKQRPADNPLIAHIGNLDQISLLAAETTPAAELLIERFFPGPLTVVLKRSARVPLIATAGLDTIGVRMPRHPLASAFLAACAMPVAAPSANLSGRPSPTTWQAVLEDLDGRIDCILQGSATEIGLESTVVDCSGSHPTLLRAGAISMEELLEICPDVQFPAEADETPRSPGMRHRHYSPQATVEVIDDVRSMRASAETAFIGLSQPPEGSGLVKVSSGAEEYARELFEFFRTCDRAGVSTIYCEQVPETGIGAALMDRIRRAAKG